MDQVEVVHVIMNRPVYLVQVKDCPNIEWNFKTLYSLYGKHFKPNVETKMLYEKNIY